MDNAATMRFLEDKTEIDRDRVRGLLWKIDETQNRGQRTWVPIPTSNYFGEGPIIVYMVVAFAKTT